MCIDAHLRHYLLITEKLRHCDQLLISYTNPHKPISRDTLSRWIKSVLKLSGIDTSIFTAHSVRSANTSAALSRDVPIDEIIKLAGWTGEKTFTKFYCRVATRDVAETGNFANALLRNIENK